jgi:uncharacterized damage-inducible protein DinB
MPASVPEVQGDIVDAAVLRYIDIKAGTGDIAAPGHKFTVHYTGWLRDGTKFDSSVDRKEPFAFIQGKRQVITGWDVGFEGMRAGGKRRLFVPYQMAYGEKGRGPIPPKAELIFDVELISVSEVKEVPASADLLSPFNDYENKIVALAQAVPEEKYSWRPAANVRSFAEVFLHIAYGNHLLLKIAEDQPAAPVLNKMIEEQYKAENKLTSRAEIIEQLRKNFAEVRKTLEPVREGALAKEAEFFGRATTIRGIFIVLNNHLGEHLGQAIAYARMNGITPPWSQSATPPAKQP